MKKERDKVDLKCLTFERSVENYNEIFYNLFQWCQVCEYISAIPRFWFNERIRNKNKNKYSEVKNLKRVH